MVTSSTVLKTTCPLDCPDTCSILVTVEDGRVARLQGDADHPFTRGFLCKKVMRYDRRLYSPLCVLYPQRRVGAKGEGKFARITWDEAFHCNLVQVTPASSQSSAISSQ